MVPAAFRNIPTVRKACIALAFCVSCAAAASAFPDQARIRADYHNGDFDKVIKALEGFQKSGRACTAAESLFLEKHLAVVYAANPGTRELGRYHMYKLLDLAPQADLLDMFVGEEVDGVFDKVRKEHSLRTAAKKPASVNAVAVRAPAASPTRTQAKAPVKALNPPPTQAAAVKSSWDTAPVSSRAAWETGPAQGQGGWQTAAMAYAPKAAATQSSPKPAPSRSWDDFGSSPVSSGHRASAPSGPSADAASEAADLGSDREAPEASGSAGGPAAFRSSGSPAWKEPGLWLGGGAALAVVAITFFYSSGSDAPPAKTYVVPASAAR